MKKPVGIFLGSKEFGFEILKSILKANVNRDWVVLCPDDTKDDLSCLEFFQNLASQHELPIKILSSNAELLNHIDHFEPDIMFVCGYYRIISCEIISRFKKGVLGIHNSLLPKYRGGSPLVWQIINNEAFLGSTLFQFDDGTDSGPIIHQIKIPNSSTMTIDQASKKIKNEWVNELPVVLEQYVNGSVVSVSQNNSQASYCAQRVEDDGLIDWSKEAKFIDRFIRAQSHPYPCAHIIYRGEVLKIISHQIDDRIIYGISGQVFEVSDNGVSICCGDNSLIKVETIEINGQIVSAQKILNSRNIRL